MPPRSAPSISPNCPLRSRSRPCVSARWLFRPPRQSIARKMCFDRKRLEVLFRSSVTWPMEEGTRAHGARPRDPIRAGEFEANVQGRGADGSPDSRNHSGSTRREKGETVSAEKGANGFYPTSALASCHPPLSVPSSGTIVTKGKVMAQSSPQC